VATQAFNPQMTAQQLHLDVNMLNLIISETIEAGSEMGRLDGQLNGVAASLGSAMLSDAGQILRNRLNIWSTDYAQIKRQLDDLNTRVTAMRNVLVSSNTGAAGSAGGGQS